jgi:hypothetical protein
MRGHALWVAGALRVAAPAHVNGGIERRGVSSPPQLAPKPRLTTVEVVNRGLDPPVRLPPRNALNSPPPDQPPPRMGRPPTGGSSPSMRR